VSYVEQATDEARRTAQLALDRSRDRLLRAGYAATGSLGSGWPAADLLDRVEHDGADLLVVGARGIGPFERIAMGSVSAHVVRHAPATLVAPAARASTDTVHVEGPDEDVPLRRYAVRWR
jgi:nucleotide-binding universal stress UspA family protein